MSDTTTIELKDIDSEEISDVLQKVEKSFGFKFGDSELNDVKTFGELCDIITNRVQGDTANDCTTQQAFYKLRSAIARTQFIDKAAITPDTELQVLFPRRNRRQNIKGLQNELGTPIDILDIKAWLGWTIFIGIVASFIMFFFNWEFAVSSLLFFIAMGWTAYKFFAKEFELKTLGQLAEKLAREQYQKSRRNPTTVNRNEVAGKIRELFKADLDLEESELTSKARFV